MPKDFQPYVQKCVVKILHTEGLGCLARLHNWAVKSLRLKRSLFRAQLTTIGTGFWVLPHYCLTCLHNLEDSINKTVLI